VNVGEIEALLETHGFDLLDLVSAESLSIGIEREVGDVVEKGGPNRDMLLALMVGMAGDPRLLGMARHLLFVGRRRRTLCTRRRHVIRSGGRRRRRPASHR